MNPPPRGGKATSAARSNEGLPIEDNAVAPLDARGCILRASRDDFALPGGRGATVPPGG